MRSNIRTLSNSCENFNQGFRPLAFIFLKTSILQLYCRTCLHYQSVMDTLVTPLPFCACQNLDSSFQYCLIPPLPHYISLVSSLPYSLERSLFYFVKDSIFDFVDLLILLCIYYTADSLNTLNLYTIRST